MTGLPEFLSARLDETAATASYSGPARVAWLTLHDADGNLRYTTVAAELGDGGGQGWVADGKELPEPAFTRIVYDPARVLREVEAGRALIAEYGRALEKAPGNTPLINTLIRLMQVLAAVWNDHPDYRQEWAGEQS